jgi:hypothetical protein
VSFNSDLLSLAQRITELYQLPPVQSSIDAHALPNRYIADPQSFLAALAHYGMIPTSLDHQLHDTAAGLVDGPNGTLGL